MIRTMVVLHTNASVNKQFDCPLEFIDCVCSRTGTEWFGSMQAPSVYSRIVSSGQVSQRFSQLVGFVGWPVLGELVGPRTQQ